MFLALIRVLQYYWSKDLVRSDEHVLDGLYRELGLHMFGSKILLCRPFMSYRMGSAILCRAGTELGQTFHGHHDFQLTDDIIHKVHIGHYTFYSKSIVRSPKHMYIAEDVFCTGYVSGENCKFITNANELPGSGTADHSIIAAPVRDEELNNPLTLRNGLAYPMSTDAPLNSSREFTPRRPLKRPLKLASTLTTTHCTACHGASPTTK